MNSGKKQADERTFIFFSLSAAGAARLESSLKMQAMEWVLQITRAARLESRV